MKIDQKELLEKYFPQAIEDLKTLISFKSVADIPQPNAPYGVGNQQALDYAINLAKEWGFTTYQDPDNRYGFFDYGTGEKLFVILCHLDVVPPGDLTKWSVDPFQATIIDNRLVGSGTADNKGPTMINMYALKYLKDHQYLSDYKIRLFFGLTEETTWASIKAYIADFGYADLGYTPDWQFPVVYAEKTAYNLDFVSTRTIDFEINGGDAYNVINDLVTYQGPLINEAAKVLEEHHIPYKIEANQLTVYGKPGHASLPAVGINASTWLGYALHEVGMKDPVIEFLAKLHLNFDGTNLLPDLTDASGSLSQNVGIVRVKNGSQLIGINYRIPISTDPETGFLEPLRIVGQNYGFEIKINKFLDAVNMDQNSPLIKKMMQAYQESTGDLTSKPLAIGGGTYARIMPNTVAFGGQFNIETAKMHEHNESTSIADLQKTLEIYTKALVLLTSDN